MGPFETDCPVFSLVITSLTYSSLFAAFYRGQREMFISAAKIMAEASILTLLLVAYHSWGYIPQRMRLMETTVTRQSARRDTTAWAGRRIHNTGRESGDPAGWSTTVVRPLIRCVVYLLIQLKGKMSCNFVSSFFFFLILRPAKKIGFR